MVKREFTISGADALSDIFEQAYIKAPKSATKVLQNTAEKGANIGKRYVNKYGAVDTEFMRDHIVPKHPNKFESLIHSQAVYSGYVNYGTRHMFARPFFSDMVETVEEIFSKDMTDVAKGLLR